MLPVLTLLTFMSPCFMLPTFVLHIVTPSLVGQPGLPGWPFHNVYTLRVQKAIP